MRVLIKESVKEALHEEMANAFIVDNNISEEHIINLIRKSFLKFQGETVNIDISKLHGEWSGFHRIPHSEKEITYYCGVCF